MKFKVVEGFKCYNCGRSVRIVEFENGSPGIMHEPPKCEDFERLPVESYLMRTMVAIKRDKKNVGL